MHHKGMSTLQSLDKAGLKQTGVWTANTTLAAARSMSSIPSRMAALVLMLGVALCYRIPLKRREASRLASLLTSLGLNVPLTSARVCLTRFHFQPFSWCCSGIPALSLLNQKKLFGKHLPNISLCSYTGLSNSPRSCLPVYPQHQFVGPGVKWSRELTQAKNNPAKLMA